MIMWLGNICSIDNMYSVSYKKIYPPPSEAFWKNSPEAENFKLKLLHVHICAKL